MPRASALFQAQSVHSYPGGSRSSLPGQGGSGKNKGVERAGFQSYTIFMLVGILWISSYHSNVEKERNDQCYLLCL